ncbi:MAG: 16S rRNA (uracil(1498)-N(3))-methyltransferase [Sphaerochaetaceae bacterium]|nr:16S rRNA (uracil(1498)-N(3))-methyltransferase [Sphaerochaetaceae bacterium]
MRVFLFDKSFTGETTYTLKKRDRQYLIKVLRLSVGESFTAKDLEGLYYKATIIDENTLAVERTDNPEDTLLDHLSAFTDKIIPITVYQCLCKGKKNETILRMLTEAGVESVIFIKSQYTQEKDFTDHERERLETIMKEAVQQSGSLTRASLDEVISIDNLPEIKKDELRIILHQSKREKTQTIGRLLSNSSYSSVSIIVGSEGGLSDEECELLENRGARTALLPTNILRAETAGIYAVGAIESMSEAR